MFTVALALDGSKPFVITLRSHETLTFSPTSRKPSFSTCVPISGSKGKTTYNKQ